MQMELLMETKRLLNISEQQELDVELQFDSNGLKIFKIEANQETQEETLQLIHNQPYKFNEDGSKASWVNAEDAFDWFETNRKEMF